MGTVPTDSLLGGSRKDLGGPSSMIVGRGSGGTAPIVSKDLISARIQSAWKPDNDRDA